MTGANYLAMGDGAKHSLQFGPTAEDTEQLSKKNNLLEEKIEAIEKAAKLAAAEKAISEEAAELAEENLRLRQKLEERIRAIQIASEKFAFKHTHKISAVFESFEQAGCA